MRTVKHRTFSLEPENEENPPMVGSLLPFYSLPKDKAQSKTERIIVEWKWETVLVSFSYLPHLAHQCTENWSEKQRCCSATRRDARTPKTRSINVCKHRRTRPHRDVSEVEFLTLVSLRGGVSPMVGLGRWASLSVGGVLAVVGGVVVAGLGVLFQLLGQVGPRRAGGNVVFVAILRNLQLLDETHGPERQPESSPTPVFRILT